MKASVRIKVTQIQYHYSTYTFRSTLSKIFIVLKQKKSYRNGGSQTQ